MGCRVRVMTRQNKPRFLPEGEKVSAGSQVSPGQQCIMWLDVAVPAMLL